MSYELFELFVTEMRLVASSKSDLFVDRSTSKFTWSKIQISQEGLSQFLIRFS